MSRLPPCARAPAAGLLDEGGAGAAALSGLGIAKAGARVRLASMPGQLTAGQQPTQPPGD